jgi:hypothetical protein
VDPDPHHFDNLDPHPDPDPYTDPYKSDKLDPDPDQYQFADAKPKCKEIEK